MRILWLYLLWLRIQTFKWKNSPHVINSPTAIITLSNIKDILKRLNEMDVNAALDYNESNIPKVVLACLKKKILFSGPKDLLIGRRNLQEILR